MMKRLGIAALLWFLLIMAPLQADEKQTDTIAAIVNNEIITYGEVYKRIRPGLEEIERSELPPYQKDLQKRKLFEMTLREMVDNRLTMQEAKNYNIQLDENLINQEIEQEAAKAGGMTKFLKALRDEGLTLEEFTQTVRERLTVQQLFWKKASYSPKEKRRAMVDTWVSPAEIRQYYLEHIEDYSREPRIKIRIISLFFFKHGGRRQTMSLARAIVKEYRKGADFAQLARTYSDDPRNAKLGGEFRTEENGQRVWGFIKRGDALYENVEDVAFTLKEGECSDPIACGDDPDNPIFCQIVLVVKRQPGGRIPFQETQKEIRIKLRRKKLLESLLRMRRALRAKAFIWPRHLFKDDED